eukprot:scaffold33993_cov66-Attheya_sp.AAC.4
MSYCSIRHQLLATAFNQCWGVEQTGIRGGLVARYALVAGADDDTAGEKDSLVGNGDDFEHSIE